MPDGDTTKIPADAVSLTNLLDGYGTTYISGLLRPKATVNRSELAGVNASRVNSVQIKERNILIDVVPQGDGEETRCAIYSVLPFDTMLRFYIHTQTKVVFIDGYVEEMDGDEPNGSELVISVSILCPFPWFQSVELHSLALSAGEFTVRNAGDIPAGFVWDTWNGTVSGSTAPAHTTYAGLSISIGNEKFAYNGTAATPHVVTIPGQRAFTAGSGGLAIMGTAFGMLTADSGWPRLQPGDNTLTVDCATSDDGTHNAFMWRDTYSGV